ncbi:MAG: autotransporter outer membrane beta-barrel domain-containing protein, partial [Deltaproteobacteria bacterium]|nr:autotransporter outer membrane beta-barrel domain-containing protein [Deltaproteobacteria bacterium]
YGAAGLGGAAAGLPGAPDEAAAPSHTGAAAASAFGGLGAGLAGGANLGSRTALPTLAQLLSGSRFSAATFFDPAHLAAGLEVWGSGGVASLRANPQQSGGALHYDGDSTAFFIGADRPLRQSLLAGLALGWSAGDLNFTDRAGGLELRGNLSTHTLSLHPYIGWQPGPHLRTWLMLGFGSGSVDTEEREASGAAQLSRTLNGSADSSLFMFSTGFAGRRQLSDAADLKLGLSLMRVSSDVDGGRFHDGAELPGVRGRSTRLGGEAELGRSYQFSGLSLRPFGTLRFRLDRSSLISAGEQRGMEKSLDWGAGLQAAWPNLGLDGRFALSRQLNQTGHEEQRISVDLSYDLSGDSRGLTLALQSALRQSHRPLSASALSASANALSAASAATVASTPGAPAAGQMEQSLSGEIGYGVAFRQFGHSGLLTPYGRFDLRQSTPLYAAGLRLTTTRHLSLGLESTFTPPAANSTPATYNLRLTGSLRF